MLENCNVCGAPSTNWSQDVIEGEPDNGWQTFKPYGPKRIGCDVHQTHSDQFDRNGAWVGPATHVVAGVDGPQRDSWAAS